MKKMFIFFVLGAIFLPIFFITGGCSLQDLSEEEKFEVGGVFDYPDFVAMLLTILIISIAIKSWYFVTEGAEGLGQAAIIWIILIPLYAIFYIIFLYFIPAGIILALLQWGREVSAKNFVIEFIDPMIKLVLLMCLSDNFSIVKSSMKRFTFSAYSQKFLIFLPIAYFGALVIVSFFSWLIVTLGIITAGYARSIPKLFSVPRIMQGELLNAIVLFILVLLLNLISYFLTASRREPSQFILKGDTTNEKELIKQLGKEIDIKLKKVRKRELDVNSFALDDQNHVEGLFIFSGEMDPFPVTLVKFQNLKRLIIYRCNYSDISSLNQLKGLTELFLGSNQISDIPSLSQLKGLTKLALHFNEISDISNLNHLKMLTELSLCKNQIRDISSLSHLKGLMSLDLSFNQITDISSLSQLNNLKMLDLRFNKITHLPAELLDTGMKIKWERGFLDEGIILEGNPLESPPIEIIKQGTATVREYSKSIERENRL